ncbi:uncharacterized protein BXZ73DRAFT_48489 [Epithele typhae]|uniref:uncharacterized protein n=1 Tax=Epithele typhae TaxID=378194 RepID=UPI002008DB81|nr:uncharacterized protein BXZ73DRAFT_48489 [Epithele typhae]KAH9928438.1 hypothetical protein BXZ73DRAFT_48489 [Epithele typhae]
MGDSGAPPIPGPWGFLTSGYFIGLFIMAFLLNRIQNIVVPPRRPLAFRLHQSQLDHQRRHSHSWYHILLGAFFPVDFSSTFSRTVFRLPSIYLLGKALLLWAGVLLQVQEPSAFERFAWIKPLEGWVMEKKLEDVCWYTFLSACLALCIGTLTTGLEGLNINDSAPFNLFSFAFQLYVESASHAEPKEGEDLPRPNVHVAVTILLPLFQLAVMHTLEIKPHWSRFRLAFSSATSALALAHFHYVLWLSDSPYPLTTYAARVVESLMLSVIALTVTLNALTQLLAEGALTRPLFAHAALMPRADEDFTVALFRLGTASMEATAVAGLGNEVAAVASTHAFPSSHRRRTPSPAPGPDDGDGELEIDRTGVSGLGARRGFAHEITRVRVKAASTDFWMDTVLNVAWQRHCGTFLGSAWRAMQRVVQAGWAGVCAVEIIARPPNVQWKQARTQSEAQGEARARGEEVHTDLYARFLRGEEVSDDEEEFVPEDRATPAPDAPSEGDSDDGEGERFESASEHDGDDELEHARLYADLSTSADMASAPLLLAHMMDGSSTPLTRTAYRRLAAGPPRDAVDPIDEWDAFVDVRRAEKRARMPEDENPRTCVICTVEPRDIICWPCRCLALCDDCRDNLASRSAASKHTCPCCRRSVEGYSKIYIP